MRKRPLKFKKGLGMLLGITFMANTFVLGFSTWVYGQSSFINSGNINVGVGDVTTVNALTKDETAPTETFIITQDGIDDDGKIVKECGKTFSFKIQNSLIDPNINTITYKSTLTMGDLNGNETIEPYFKCLMVNNVALTKISPFPAVSARKQQYIQSFDINLDKTSADGYTRFTMKYVFQGNFYSKLIGDLNLTLSLAQEGVN